MLIPGLPMPGAQIDPVKPKRGVQATEETAVIHETLAEPVERRRRNKGRHPERRGARRRARMTEYTPEGKVEAVSDLPTKGLLVDIEV
jgi:hypothetical protein